MKYRRILLKISGGAIGGPRGTQFDPRSIEHIVSEVAQANQLGVQVAIVAGGGNIFRGRVADEWHIERAEADNIGMLGTLINAVMLRAALKAKTSLDVRVMSAFPIPSMAEPYIRLRAERHLLKGAVVIMGGGNGQPFVTTDYPAVQRAVELSCDALLAAKDGIDGVFTADPKLDPEAARYETLSYDDVIKNDIRVMDQSAMLLARDSNLPVHVFGFEQSGAVAKICDGQACGTLLSNVATTLAA